MQEVSGSIPLGSTNLTHERPAKFSRRVLRDMFGGNILALVALRTSDLAPARTR